MLTMELLRYGYLVLFIGAAIEGDASLLTATFLAHLGYFKVSIVIATAAAATICANQTYYWLGRRHARTALDRLRTHRRYSRFRELLARHAPLLLFFSRFIYGFRIAIPLGCGASGMSPGTFAAIDAAGAAMWSILIGLTGFAIGNALEVLAGDIRRHAFWIALALMMTTLTLLAVRGRDYKGAAAAESLLVNPRDDDSK
jgi:membrane protein DedA with SNARE-associated domain